MNTMKTMMAAAALMLAAGSAAMADEPKSTPTPTQAARMGDAEMKKLLVGTWEMDDDTTNTFTSDGRWITTDPKFPNASEDERTQGWDIKNGELIEIRRYPAGARPYTILFLTEHECLLHWGHHGGGYALWTR
jgi:hypothetical protein